MTTGRINQVARKVGTHTPQKRTHARKPSDKPSDGRNTPRDRNLEPCQVRHKDRPTVHLQSRTHTEVRNSSNKFNCRHRPNELGGDLRRARPRRTEHASATSCKRHASTKTPSTSCATSLHSKVPMLSAQTAQLTHCERHTGRLEATNVEATKATRTNRAGAAPLTPAVQSLDPTQHRS